MKRALIILTLGAFLTGSLGCASMSKQEKGALIGGAAGALAGGLIGNAAGNTAIGAILGAAVGGTAGAIIGDYMDAQAEEMEQDLEGVTVERVGEGIKLTFDSGLLFAVNSADLTSQSKENLNQLASILNKYEKTEILIEGHTDADGSEKYNQELSEKRAASVRSFLNSSTVEGGRMNTVGYGESQPVADNASSEGKQQNRRVEVAIIADDELKKWAEKESGKG